MSRPSRLPVRASQLLTPSMGTNRPSTARKENIRTRASSSSRASSTGRPSSNLLGSALKRRTPQSARNLSADRKKKDARSLHDKSWQAEMLRKTQEYFQNDPNAVSVLNNGKHLKPITINMFIVLCNIALRNVDVTFEELNTKNYVEFLPNILARLEYPGVVTPSTLKTASSMHSWPHILGILSWLVELNIVYQAACDLVQQNLYIKPSDLTPDEELQLEVAQLQSRTVISSYNKWNAGQDEKEEIENFAEELRKIYKVDPCSINEAKQIEEKLSKQLKIDIENIQKLEEQIKIERVKIEKLESNNKYLDSVVSEQLDYTNRAEKKIEELKINLVKLKNSNEKHIDKNKKLEERVKQQPLTHKERDTLLRKIADSKAKKEWLIEERNHQQKISDEMDIKLSQMKLKIEKEIHNLNVKLLQPCLKYPELKEYVMQTDQIISAEFSQEIQNIISKLENSAKIDEKTLKTKRKALINKQKENQQEEKRISEVTEKINDLKLQIAEMKTKKEQLCASLQKQKEKATKDSEAIHSKISDVTSQFPDIDKINKSIEEETEELHTLQKNYLEDERRMAQSFENLEQGILKIIPEYKEQRIIVNNKVKDEYKKLNALKEKFGK